MGIQINGNNDTISALDGSWTSDSATHFTGKVSIGGTLTYEDVTNIDSVGIVTARAGVKIPDNQRLFLGNDNDGEIWSSGSHTYVRSMVAGQTLRLTSDHVYIRNRVDGQSMASFDADGAVDLFYNTSPKFATTNTGVSITGGADTVLLVEGTSTASRIDLKTSSHHRFWQTLESDGRFRFYDQTNAAERFSITSAGKVGIGITNPAEKFEVSGGNIAIVGGSSYKIDTHPLVSYAGFTDISGGSYAARLGSTGSSTIRSTQIYGGGSHIATFDGVNNRLGINIAVPTKKLDIATAASADGIRIKSTGNTYNELNFDANRTSANTHIGRVISYWNGSAVSYISFDTGSDTTNKDDGYMRFWTADGSGNFERLRIHADGEVECKGGAAGQNALLVSADYSGAGNVDIQTWQRIGGAVKAKMTYKDADTSMHFGTSTAHKLCLTTGGTERLHITSTGNIGINQDSPQRILHVGKSGTAEANIRIQGGSDYGEIRVKDSDNNLSFHHNVGGAGSRELFNSNGSTGHFSINCYSYQALTITTNENGTNGPEIQLMHNSASPAAGDIVGQLRYSGKDSAGNTELYSKIETKATTVTSGSETGHVDFSTRGGGAYNSMFRLSARGTASAPSYTTDDMNGIILDTYNTGNPYPRYFNFIAKSAGNTDSNIGFWTEAVGGSPTEKLRIKSTGEVHMGASSPTTSDAGADDLVIGNTTDGVNRGLTIWSHTSQNGNVAFADNDANFRGAVQYIHGDDQMRFLATGEEKFRVTEHGTYNTPITGGDSVNTKAGARFYTISGATPLDGTNTNETETPLMRCGHSFNGTMRLWMAFNGDQFHLGCRQMTIDCQGTYGYVNLQEESAHNQNALGAGLNSLVFQYQNTGSPNYYFKVKGTWASGQNTPYILWTWTGHNSEYPYAL